MVTGRGFFYAGFVVANIRLGATRLYAGPAGSNLQLPAVSALTDWSTATFARASVATFWDKDDINGAGPLLYKYAVNVPRILADGSIVIEKAHTNLSLRSNEIDLSPWSSSGSVTVTPNAGTAPDGLNTAERLQITSGAQRLQAGTLGAVNHTLSAFLKPYASDLDWQLSLAGVSGTIARGALGGLASGWERKALPYFNPGAGAGSWAFDGTNQTANGGVAAHTEDVLASNVQLQQQAYASEPIETAGSIATQAKETAYITLPASLTVGTWEVDFWPAFSLAEYQADPSLPSSMVVMRSNAALYENISLYNTGAIKGVFGGDVAVKAAGPVLSSWSAGDKFTVRMFQETTEVEVLQNDISIFGPEPPPTPPYERWHYASGKRLYLHNTNNGNQGALRISQIRRV